MDLKSKVHSFKESEVAVCSCFRMVLTSEAS